MVLTVLKRMLAIIKLQVIITIKDDPIQLLHTHGSLLRELHPSPNGVLLHTYHQNHLHQSVSRLLPIISLQHGLRDMLLQRGLQWEQMETYSQIYQYVAAQPSHYRTV